MSAYDDMIEKERQECFEAVDIYVGATVNRLCNKMKHDEAIALEDAWKIVKEKCNFTSRFS